MMNMMINLRSQIMACFVHIEANKTESKSIARKSTMLLHRYVLIICNKSWNLRDLASLLMYVINHYISILTDCMTSRKITFDSKMDILEKFWDKKYPRTTLRPYTGSIVMTCVI